MNVKERKDDKCFWHPDIHGTCTCYFPISSYHCPDCNFCMKCGGFDLPINFTNDADEDFFRSKYQNYDKILSIIRKRNEPVAFLYGKPNGN